MCGLTKLVNALVRIPANLILSVSCVCVCVLRISEKSIISCVSWLNFPLGFLSLTAVWPSVIRMSSRNNRTITVTYIHCLILCLEQTKKKKASRTIDDGTSIGPRFCCMAIVFPIFREREKKKGQGRQKKKKSSLKKPNSVPEKKKKTKAFWKQKETKNVEASNEIRWGPRWIGWAVFQMSRKLTGEDL